MELLATLEPFARRHHLIQHCTLKGGDVYRSLHGYCCSFFMGPTSSVSQFFLEIRLPGIHPSWSLSCSSAVYSFFHWA